MRRVKKRLLSMTGVAAVMLMATVAYIKPVPSAMAEESSLDFQVTVVENNTSATISNPQDGTRIVESNLDVKTNYSAAGRLEYILRYQDAGGATKEVVVRDIKVSERTGVDQFNLNLSGYGYGSYALIVRAYRDADSGNVSYEDTVNFTFEPTSQTITEGGSVTGNGDPTLDLEIGDQVEKVLVQVYDANGNPVFVNANGQEEPLYFNRSDLDPNTGRLIMDLPMAKYGAKPGRYTAVIRTYDGNDQLLSTVNIDFDYAGDKSHTINTPNTGAVSEGLNVSRLDWLITGLIAFGAVSGMAVYMIYRRRHQ